MALSSDSPDVPALIAQLKSLKHNTIQDAALRTELYETVNELSRSIETPRESILRIIYSPLQITIAKIASNLNLFDILGKGGVKNTKELAEETKADVVLLGRILRGLASFGIIQETGDDQYAANNISKSLTIPGFKAGLNHNFNTVSPAIFSIPKFLADTKYENPSDMAHSPFQLAFKTDLPAFIWAFTPEAQHLLQDMGVWMSASHAGLPNWLDGFPFEEFAQNATPETIQFVDVGGGVGHQCVSLRTKFPDLKGRVILQDQAVVIPQAIPHEGVEATVHDFWTEQPVKGARAYYFRNIMHDYPDELCVKLLKLTIDAMGKDSVILIDDMVLPEKGVHWQATQLDFTMLAALAGRERTQKEWYALFDAAGLEVKKVYPYTTELNDSIIVVVPK